MTKRRRFHSIPGGNNARPFSLADLEAAKRAAGKLEDALKQKVATNRRLEPLGCDILDKQDGRVTMQFSRHIRALSMDLASAEEFLKKFAQTVLQVRAREEANASLRLSDMAQPAEPPPTDEGEPPRDA